MIALEGRLRRRGIAVKIIGYGPESGSKDFQSIVSRSNPRGRDLSWSLWRNRNRWDFSPGTVIHLQRPDQAMAFTNGPWPLVISVHGCHRQSVRVRQGLFAGMAYQYFQSRVARRADAYIFETQKDLKDYVSRIPTVQKKSHFIPIGIDRERFFPGDQTSARKMLGLPQEVPAVAYLGRLEKEKNVIALIRAIERLPGVELWIAGRGKEEAACRREAGPRVRFLGFLPPESVPTFLRASDVLALSSHHEGLATVVLQAWASGRPVVVAPVGDFPDLLLDGGGVLAKDNRPESLAIALGEILENRVADSGPRKDQEQIYRAKSDPYDWDVITDQICDLYEKVLNGRVG